VDAFRVAALAILLTAFANAQELTASLMGALQDPSGAALAGASVILESEGGGNRQEIQADERGIFRFLELKASKYTLSIRRLGFYGVKVKQDLLAGEQKSLPPIRLSVGVAGDCFPNDSEPERSRFLSTGPSIGGLAGNLSSGQGPAAGVRVLLACWGQSECRGASETIVTDSRGDFAFENLRPGRYNVSAEELEFFPFNARADIAGGLESVYSFSLTPCPNGDCTVKLIAKVNATTCE